MQVGRSDFKQVGMEISFKLNSQSFSLHLPGKHNAIAATAVAHQLGVDLATCAAALEYWGITAARCWGKERCLDD
jgi:UDP-N-acetylmuramate--alanine ligase